MGGRVRASRACASCYALRTKCNVVHQSPCTNCTGRNIKCRPRQRRQRQYTQSKATSIGESHEKNDERCVNSREELAMIDVVPWQPLQTPTGYLNSVDGEETVGNTTSDGLTGDGQPCFVPPAPYSHDNATLLAPFFQPLPSKYTESDISYLQIKGALAIPSTKLQNSLLAAYCQYAFPYLPAINLHEFLRIVNDPSGSSGQTSLLLYQTVMLSAAAFVDEKCLYEEGYASRKEARRVFYERAKLLYNFDYEPRTFVLIQAALLMTYWREPGSNTKDMVHWISIAITMALSIELHKSPTPSNEKDSCQSKLRRRVWWSCIMRDCLISLATEKLPNIREEAIPAEMLTEDDFELYSVSASQIFPLECSFLSQIWMQRQLALFCIEQAKICLLIGRIVLLYNSSDKAGWWQGADILATPSETQFDAIGLEKENLFASIDLALTEWSVTLPEECRYLPVVLSDTLPCYATLAIQRATLHMLHQTAVLALHRPRALSYRALQNSSATSWQQIGASHFEMEQAAINIATIGSNLHDHQLDRFVPAVTIIFILPAAVTNLQSMVSFIPEARDAARWAFNCCLGVFDVLSKTFHSAEYLPLFLKALERAGADKVGCISV